MSPVYKQRALRALEQAQGKIDPIYSGGDIGTQCGMMLSPDLRRQHVKPYASQLIHTFKDMTLITMSHSCGSSHSRSADVVHPPRLA